MILLLVWWKIALLILGGIVLASAFWYWIFTSWLKGK